MLIASSTRITLDGTISAVGGNGGPELVALGRGGGGGGGGAIRLAAPDLEGSGSLQVGGGTGIHNGGHGGPGRVRLEAFQHNFAGSTDPETRLATPGPVLPPPSSPRVRVVSINGATVPTTPLGNMASADLTIDTSSAATIQIEAENIPLGTLISLTMLSESREKIEAQSTPLTGTFENSTATATITIPAGFSLFNVVATWNP